MSTVSRTVTPASIGADASVDEALVSMTDGIRLAATIYLPRARKTRIPTVMLRVPYGRAGDICFIPGLADLLVGQGFAVVAQDVRGKFDSEGIREPFVHEVLDGRDTMEWIASQAWSDGGVVAIGDSYPGYTAWAAGVCGHRALRGVIARMTTTLVSDGWIYRQGAFRLQMMAEWAAFAWSDPGLTEVAIDWSVRPLRDIAITPQGEASGPLLSWAARDRTGWRRETLPSSGSITVPILGVGGWWDVFSRGQIADLVARRPRSSDRTFTVMRAVDHEFHRIDEVASGPIDHMNDPASRAAGLPRIYAEVLDFLSRVVRDDLSSLPVVRYDLSHAGPRSATSWPPPEAVPYRLFLIDGPGAAFGPEGGGLRERPDTIPSLAVWPHDPSTLVPSLETDPWGILFDPADERDVEMRDDVLTFTSEAMRTPLDIAGPVVVTLFVATTAQSVMLVATLVDVRPDGRATRIVEGATRVRRPVGDEPVQVDLGPTAYRLRQGHRLRLEVASSAFPRYMWEPGTGEDPWVATSGIVSEQSLRIGSDGAFLDLRVLAS